MYKWRKKGVFTPSCLIMGEVGSKFRGRNISSHCDRNARL